MRRGCINRLGLAVAVLAPLLVIGCGSTVGGPDGDFDLGPEHDAVLGIVAPGDDLLLVLVLASRDELQDAWTEAQPILQSIDL